MLKVAKKLQFPNSTNTMKYTLANAPQLYGPPLDRIPLYFILRDY